MTDQPKSFLDRAVAGEWPDDGILVRKLREAFCDPAEAINLKADLTPDEWYMLRSLDRDDHEIQDVWEDLAVYIVERRREEERLRAENRRLAKLRDQSLQNSLTAVGIIEDRDKEIAALRALVQEGERADAEQCCLWCGAFPCKPGQPWHVNQDAPVVHKSGCPAAKAMGWRTE